MSGTARRLGLVALLAAAALWLLLDVPTPFVVYEPGLAAPLEPIVSVESGDEPGKGTFYLTTVKMSSVDNFLRPRLVAGRVRLSGVAMFVAMLGGLQAFGALGIILGPVLFATAAAILDVLRETQPSHAVRADASEQKSEQVIDRAFIDILYEFMHKVILRIQMRQLQPHRHRWVQMPLGSLSSWKV